MISQGSREARRKLFLWFCWLYVVLGSACLASGIYLSIVVSRVESGNQIHSLGAIRALCALLIVFGLWRTGLALFHIRRAGKAGSRK